MIERGGLTAMFEGTDPDYEKITFFAIPSYTILRYLWDNDLKADIAYRNPDYLITDQKQDGGTALTTVGGRKLKAYVDKSSYGGRARRGERRQCTCIRIRLKHKYPWPRRTSSR